MNLLKVTNGKVELRKDTGVFIRTIVSSGAVSADINSNQNLILVTYQTGKVELRKDNGMFVRTI